MRHESTVLDDSMDAQLYRRTAPALLAYLMLQVGTREDAEDLLLEVFLAALENKRFRALQESKQLAWLRTVARNKVADHYRHLSRHPSIPLIQIADMIYDCEELEPEQLALRHEEYARLYSSLSELSRSQQEVLQLRFGHGLNCMEIAVLMEKSEGAIRMLLSRTLKLLRDRYAKS